MSQVQSRPTPYLVDTKTGLIERDVSGETSAMPHGSELLNLLGDIAEGDDSPETASRVKQLMDATGSRLLSKERGEFLAKKSEVAYEDRQQRQEAIERRRRNLERERSRAAKAKASALSELEYAVSGEEAAQKKRRLALPEMTDAYRDFLLGGPAQPPPSPQRAPKQNDASAQEDESIIDSLLGYIGL